jgi:hypothetical protein
MQALIGDRERIAKIERDEIEKVERVRRQVEKTAAQQTQEIADKRWPQKDDDQRWTCRLLTEGVVVDPHTQRRMKDLVTDPAFPEVSLFAGSEEEARIRYQLVCGINHTENKIAARLAGAAPEPEPELKMQAA